jgi:hypothetical protein
MDRDLKRRRWALPLIGLVGLGAGLLIGLVASGDGDTETTTTTVVSTTTRDGGDGGKRTRTVRRGRTRTRTVVRTQTVTVGGDGGGRPVSVPGGGRSFSGRNGRTIGTLRVPRKSTIRWTNKGDVFTLLSERQIHVSSTKRRGTAALQRGTYNDFRVAALGSWTLRIIPR